MNINISIPATDTEFLSWISSNTSADYLVALKIGYLAIKHTSNIQKTDGFVKTITEHCDKKLDNISSQFISRIEELDSFKKILYTTISSNIDQMQHKHQELLHTIDQQNNLKSQNNIKIHSLIEQIESLHHIFTTVKEQISSFGGSIQTHLQPVMTEVTHLSTSINSMTKITNNSSLKGAMGENIVLQNIESSFPEISIIDKSSKSFQSDIHFMSDPPILIEVKTYKNNVSSKEINKFKRDIEITDMKAGILISTTSGIVGKKNLDWEIYKDAILLYIPNAGLHASSGVFGIMFIQELFKLHNNSNNSNMEIDDCKIMSILDEISEAIPEIESNLTQFNIVKKSICDIRECLNKKIDELFVQFTTSQTLLSSSIRKLTSQFRDSFQSLTNCDSSISTIQQIDDFISELSKHKKSLSDKFILLKSIITDLNCFIKITDKSWYIFSSNKKKIAFTKNTATRLDIQFPVTIGNKVSFIFGVETFKNNNIIITVSKKNIQFIIQRINKVLYENIVD